MSTVRVCWRLSEDPPPSEPTAVRFHDRHHAGQRLAALLEPLRGERPIVVGIPRGGVVVAAEVAHALGARLDVAVVRKIGAPQNPEYALGALAEGGVHVLNHRAVSALGLGASDVQALIAGVERDLEVCLRRYRGVRKPLELTGQTVILIDDGLATGSSALAAIGSVRRRGAARVVLAVPVAPSVSVEALRDHVEQVVCVKVPPGLRAVGYWYEDFSPTSDEEVARLLRENACVTPQPPEPS
jgi:putative phosphoribosyl transferase